MKRHAIKKNRAKPRAKRSKKQEYLERPKRGYMLRVRLSDAERLEALDKANALGLDLSGYVRFLVRTDVKQGKKRNSKEIATRFGE
jgi:hypothetical protein